MEKLQKALQQAREQRRGSPNRTDRDPAGGGKSSGLAHVPPASDIWSDLTPFEPDRKHLAARRVMTLEAGLEANPFDFLRTKIVLHMRKQNWSRIAITSPHKACGKTTVACNFATGMSRQKTMRSLLMDFDLRAPGVAATMGQTPERDVAELLQGKCSPEEQLLLLRGNVAFAMAKKPYPDPAGLLLSQNTMARLDDLEQILAPDITIFDLPPMLATDETRAVLRHVDCALIVARAEKTGITQLDRCEQEVSEYTNVLGTVLNNCRHLDPQELHHEYY